MISPHPTQAFVPRQRSRRRGAKARARREGAALLIVLFVLMMATSTAVFAMQSTQFEQRAAGSLHQAMRTKFVAEAATVGVLAFCYQMGTAGCTDLKRSTSNFSRERRERYALPEWKAETVYELQSTDLTGPNFPQAVIPKDQELAAGGRATAFTPSFTTLMEKWEVPNPGETRERYRLIVSTYGQLGHAADVQSATEKRGGHESISATRAYFDVR